MVYSASSRLESTVSRPIRRHDRVLATTAGDAGDRYLTFPFAIPATIVCPGPNDPERLELPQQRRRASVNAFAGFIVPDDGPCGDAVPGLRPGESQAAHLDSDTFEGEMA